MNKESTIVKGKKYLFVTYHFHPNGDANSVITYNIAKELIARGAIVTVLYITDRRINIKEFDGINLEPIYIPTIRYIKLLWSEFKTHPIETFSLVTQKILTYPLNYLLGYKKLSAEYFSVIKYRRKIKKHFINKTNDYFIATLEPIEAAIAMLQAKRQSDVFALYQMDTFWNNAIKNPNYQQNRIQCERKLAKECLFNLTTEQISQTSAEFYENEPDKLIKSEFPMMIKPDIKKLVNNGTIKKCVFTGTLYADIRPPENIIKIIAELKMKDVQFDFYGLHQELIQKDPLYQQAKEYINLHGVVETKEAERVRQTADFLINIDNTCVEQVPSKIFEYIATGKPIINFYFNKNSAILKHMEKYPLKTNIFIGKQFELSEACEKICEFISTAHGKNVPYDTVERIYEENTPQYVANQLISAYNRF